MTEVECPTCGKCGFNGEKGLKIHHQFKHNEPLGENKFGCESCDRIFSSKEQLNKHYFKTNHRESGSKCPSCGELFENLGKHIGNSKKCDIELSQKQEEILTGILMGDGSMVSKDSKNCAMKIEMKNKKYLQSLKSKFGVLTRKNLYENSGSTHKLYIRGSKKLNEYKEWYSSGNKVWPENIKLTPTVLKHWYVCDGSLNRSKGSRNPRIIIYMSNEHQNTEKVDKYFKKVNLPTPSNYLVRERDRHYNDDKFTSCSAQFSVDDSKTLWGYMGEPLPGFDYKWPEESE